MSERVKLPVWLCWVDLCPSVTQTSKGAAEKKTKVKSDKLDEEIASDSDDE